MGRVCQEKERENVGEFIIDGEAVPDPRKGLIDIFNKAFLYYTGKKNPFPYGACMRTIRKFESIDEVTGECFIEYPDESEWREQIEGFFQDDFARENRGFHFTYLLKQYGSFVRHTAITTKKKITPNPQLIECDHCHTIHGALDKCKVDV